jgi:hypothetical protein
MMASRLPAGSLAVSGVSQHRIPSSSNIDVAGAVPMQQQGAWQRLIQPPPADDYHGQAELTKIF